MRESIGLSQHSLNIIQVIGAQIGVSIPRDKYHFVVRVTGKDVPAEFGIFESWMDEHGGLQCQQCELGTFRNEFPEINVF